MSLRNIPLRNIATTLAMLAVVVCLHANAQATVITATWTGTAQIAAGSSPVLGTPEVGDTVIMKFTYDTDALSGAQVFNTPNLVQYNTFPNFYAVTTVSFASGPVLVVDNDYLGYLFLNTQTGTYREYFGNASSGSMDGGSTGDQFAAATLQRVTGAHSPTDPDRLFSLIFDESYYAVGQFQLADQALNYISAQVYFTSVSVTEGGQGPSDVPVPSGLALLAVGLIGAGGLRAFCSMAARHV